MILCPGWFFNAIVYLPKIVLVAGSGPEIVSFEL